MNPAPTLVVGPSWVGDMVMAQSLFILLRERDPERQIDVLAPGWSLPIVARMPQVRRGIAAETGHGELGLGKRRRIAYRLKEEGYGRAIILPRSLKSALIPWLARIPRRTGFRGESRWGLINDIRPFDRDLLDQTVKRFVALGLEPCENLPARPNPVLSIDEDNQRRVMHELGVAGERPVIAMMPGAEYGPAKCWPIEHFRQLAKVLREDGYDVWVLGSDKDAEAGEAITAGGAVNLCGRTSLEDVIDLLGHAEQAVSNDSGLMHIAAAVGSWVHGIYGSSSPSFTPPLTEHSTIHSLGLDCSPCFERECPLGHLRCLRDLSVESVHDAVLQARKSASKHEKIN
jgi:heptosyltransferase-2